jgi:6,7-dimethyl-8-ribityllumazine synthase
LRRIELNMGRFLIVEARFYDHLNDMLIEGARAALKAAGHKAEVITVPGALEIPAAISLADATGDFDGFVAIGVVIRGETYHFEIVAGESARGVMALTMDGIAIGNGILTVENEAQALERADPAQKDKGGEAARAAVALHDLKVKFG